MNTDIQVRRRRKSGLIEVIDRSPEAIEAMPDTSFGINRGKLLAGAAGRACEERVQGGKMTLYTRIWMCAAPPSDGDAGYVGVLGEEFDGRWRLVERPLRLLDEVSELMLPRLFRGASALKDLYWADQIYIDPADDAFISDMMRPRWGLSAYDPDYQEHELRERFPTFVSIDRTCACIEPPYRPDPKWGRELISALFAEDLLDVDKRCEVFLSKQASTPHRALALGVMAMQAWDWSGRYDGADMLDGYDADDEYTDEELAHLRASEEHINNVLYMVGDPQIRNEIDRLEQHQYEPVVPQVDRPRGELAVEDLEWLA